MTHTIRFAGIATFGDEIRAFNNYGPTPTRQAYDEVLATFPATAKGHKAALAFCDARPIERGVFMAATDA